MSGTEFEREKTNETGLPAACGKCAYLSLYMGSSLRYTPVIDTRPVMYTYVLLYSESEFAFLYNNEKKTRTPRTYLCCALYRMIFSLQRNLCCRFFVLFLPEMGNSYNRVFTSQIIRFTSNSKFKSQIVRKLLLRYSCKLFKTFIRTLSDDCKRFE